jgi:hypothetical protein
MKPVKEYRDPARKITASVMGRIAEHVSSREIEEVKGDVIRVLKGGKK